MRIPFDHPLHSFVEVPNLTFNLSATGRPSVAYMCRTCGIMGTRVNGSPWLHVQENAPTARRRAQQCAAMAMQHGTKPVLVLTEDLPEKGLSRSQTYPIMVESSALSEGVWVRGPTGDVMLTPDNCVIVRVRKRTRIAPEARA